MCPTLGSIGAAKTCRCRSRCRSCPWVPNARKHRSGENGFGGKRGVQKLRCPTLGSIGAAKTLQLVLFRVMAFECPTLGSIGAAKTLRRIRRGELLNCAQRSEASERRKPIYAVDGIASDYACPTLGSIGAAKTSWPGKGTPTALPLCPTLGSIGAAKTPVTGAERTGLGPVPNARKHRSGENPTKPHAQPLQFCVPNARKHRSGENSPVGWVRYGRSWLCPTLGSIGAAKTSDTTVGTSGGGRCPTLGSIGAAKTVEISPASTPSRRCPTLGSIGAAKTIKYEQRSRRCLMCPTLGSIGAAKTSPPGMPSAPTHGAQRSEASERRKPPPPLETQIDAIRCPTLGSIGAAKTSQRATGSRSV